MSRTIRSEFSANVLQAQACTQRAASAAAHESTCEDWRRVLARRDVRRAALRNVQPVRQMGGIRLTVALILIVVGAGAYVAWHAAVSAVSAIAATHQA